MFFALTISTALAISAVVLMLQAVILWLAARWLNFTVPAGPRDTDDADETPDADQADAVGALSPAGDVRFVRILLACVANGLIVLALAFVATTASLVMDDAAITAGAGRPAWIPQVLPLAMLIVQIPMAWVCLRFLGALRWSDAAIATMILMFSGYVLHIPGKQVEQAVSSAVRVTTDGMAPAVCGVHTEMTCPNCGFRYAFGLRDYLARNRGLAAVSGAVCPNCAQETPVAKPASAYFGDRVIVDKRRRAQRWDIVMFDWEMPPPDKPLATDKPSATDEAKAPPAVVTTLLDRVIGLPGETVEICGGDVFVNGKRLQKLPLQSPELWLPVHDTQCAPQTVAAAAPRWEPAERSTRWKNLAGRWTCADGDRKDSLQFTGRLADLHPYEGRDGTWTAARDAAAPLVGDVRVQCEISEFLGAGSLAFEWEFGGQQVTATIIAPGRVELVARNAVDTGASEPPVVRATLPDSVHSAAWLTFAVRDGQAYVMQQDTMAALVNVGAQDLETAQHRLLHTKPEPCRLRISASRAGVTLSRIVLSRDVYYRSLDEIPNAPLVVPHGTFHHPLVLKADEYFVLGDHSARSPDSRIFGALTGKQLLGVVQGVFWPLNHWHEFH